MDPDRRRDALLQAIDRQLEGIAHRVLTPSVDGADRAHGFLMIDLLDDAGAPLDAGTLRDAGIGVEAVESLGRFRRLESACLERGWSVRALLHWEHDTGVLRIVVDVAA